MFLLTLGIGEKTVYGFLKTVKNGIHWKQTHR
jgi:hypothetical protein